MGGGIDQSQQQKKRRLGGKKILSPGLLLDTKKRRTKSSAQSPRTEWRDGLEEKGGESRPSVKELRAAKSREGHRVVLSQMKDDNGEQTSKYQPEDGEEGRWVVDTVKGRREKARKGSL